MNEKRFASYGPAPVPNENQLISELDRLPPKFAAAKKQAFITRDVSVLIAEELRRQGTEVNLELVKAAHLARPISRHKGVGSVEGVGAVKGVVHTQITKELLKRHFKSDALASMISKYYSLRNPRVIEHLKTEDVPFLIGGYMVWGEHSVEKGWNHSVHHPDEILAKYLEGAEKDARTREARFNYLTEEYDNGVKPLAEWLASKGVDLNGIAREVNRRVREGAYNHL
ncbi:hypothetical protein H0O03_04325 [Candidatus Micrarchaeota archaeon]|nr:hypothetical protein [Candidatus Micrarchaeota archaeon]